MVSPNAKIFGNPNLKVYLFTESGYLMIVKCLDDDMSWQVQRCLVNNYFNKPFVAQRAISAEQFSVDYPKPIYKTSSTPIPRNTKWYRRNRRRMMLLAEKCNVSVTKVYSQILTTLGEEFDLDTANEIFKQESFTRDEAYPGSPSGWHYYYIPASRQERKSKAFPSLGVFRSNRWSKWRIE